MMHYRDKQKETEKLTTLFFINKCRCNQLSSNEKNNVEHFDDWLKKNHPNSYKQHHQDWDCIFVDQADKKFLFEVKRISNPILEKTEHILRDFIKKELEPNLPENMCDFSFEIHLKSPITKEAINCKKTRKPLFYSLQKYMISTIEEISQKVDELTIYKNSSIRIEEYAILGCPNDKLNLRFQEASNIGIGHFAIIPYSESKLRIREKCPNYIKKERWDLSFHDESQLDHMTTTNTRGGFYTSLSLETLKENIGSFYKKNEGKRIFTEDHSFEKIALLYNEKEKYHIADDVIKHARSFVHTEESTDKLYNAFYILPGKPYPEIHCVFP